ncbi:type II secretion system minor pseudopilin GspI [Kangiella shandongensis]|uniref:type II secretion system minor pseudopilin GspI n=1 Tax=Kangiella shandongensis TaxID=2763258 RepID=UPI001CC1839B|nr:type II secretion system minor pseudopilin GspI [Kangiella shandongensis]
MNKLNRRQRGLSLLELLIALAVFSIFILPMLSGLFSSSVIALGNSKDKTLANFVAQNHFAELQLDDDWPSIGKKQGETEYAGRTWEWEQNVVGTEVEDMRRVTVSVLYGEEGVYTMTGFVGKKTDKRSPARR